ncbi:MAG: MBL fold metallo-hydrolase [Acidimicrobiia bacterium]|nr:MBL fold metallo-hydrolase [Acidimicrobiia bacterium]MCY4434408.1 MBL fold metallo-hydrolase [bacterium]
MAVSIPFVTEPEVDYGAVVEMAPGLRRVMANNPSKFTYRGTGTYIVGQGRVAIVDPGPDDADHVAAVLAAVDGEQVEALLITHTHRDHSPASRAVAEATGAPAYGFGPHPASDTDDGKSEERGDTDFAPDMAVVHGDVVEGPGWSFECLYTPGHISNHVAYRWREADGVFTGDHIMGWSTTVIPPPDGNMTDYLSSLRLLADSPGDRVYWPTHGPPVTEPHALVEALYAHRLDRERQILECLATGPQTIAEMVEVMYADVATELHEPAARSVLAHLIAMVGDGRVDTDGDASAKAVYFRE